MGLPSRVFWTLPEAALKWGCMPPDIAGWALNGLIELSAPVPPTECGDQVISGLVGVNAACVMPMFRRDGTELTSCRVRRLKPRDSGRWEVVTRPCEGVEVHRADLAITTVELQRFEADFELVKRPHAGTGPVERYDWEAMLVQVAVRIYENGLPETQKVLVNELQEWFIRRSETGEAPDESRIRRKIAPLWRALRGTE